MEPLWMGNDHLIRLDGLKDEMSGNFLNGATVSATLKDSAGAVVAGPLTLDYVAASDGRYEAVLDSSTPTTKGAIYTLDIEASQGGAEGVWRRVLRADHRR